MMTSETRPPSTPARFSASWIATLPSSWAGRLESAAIEGADRRAGRADDDDIVFHCENSLFCCGREAPAGLVNMWVL